MDILEKMKEIQVSQQRLMQSFDDAIANLENMKKRVEHINQLLSIYCSSSVKIYPGHDLMEIAKFNPLPGERKK